MRRPSAPHVLRAPEQGWSSLGLLLGMLILVGASVATARPLTIGSTDPSSSLLVMMGASGIIGYLLARARIGVVRAHVLGAAAGAFLLLAIATGAVEMTLDPDELAAHAGAWDEVRIRLALLRDEIRESFLAYQESRAGSGVVSTPTVVTFLVLGAVLWTTGQFSAFSIFRYDRGGPAVMAIGVVLFLNVGLDTQDDLVRPLPVLPQLAAFSAMAMLLLMRLQLTQQGYQWARRHIADAGEVGRLFLRTGVLFVALSVAGASTLTVAANMGRHELPDLGGIEDALDDVGEQIAELLPFIGATVKDDRPGSVGGSFRIDERWTPGQGIAFTATVEGRPAADYWWLSAHDVFDGWSWQTSEAGTEDVAAGERFETTPVLGGAFVPVRSTIEVQDQTFAATVFGAVDTAWVEAPVTLSKIVGEDVGRVEFQDDRDPVRTYEVDTLARDYSRGPDALTSTELQAAGTDYPLWVLDRYLQGTEPGSTASGQRTRAKARQLLRQWDENPYDMALAIQDELSGMTYETDLSALCGDLNVPECVLVHEQGYCQFYASTMVMVLREAGVPSRIVRGFLPGVEQLDGSWEVENAAYHAWVEVYFPRYGWVRFDPTPGTVQGTRGLEQTELPEGAPRPTRRPDEPLEPTPGFDDETFPPEPTPSLMPFPAATCEELGRCDDGDDALVALIIAGGTAGLLVLVMVGLMFIRFRRLSEPDGSLAYRGIVSLATRLGLGPHPSQTEYEYAGTLSEVIPSVRDDLYLVAVTRVESAYGRRPVDSSRRALLRRAYARIRTALLRLSLRRRR